MQASVLVSSKAARHICEEASVVLCSLRAGPPTVARGELTHDLQDLRVHVRAYYLERSTTFSDKEMNDEKEAGTRQLATNSTFTNATEGPLFHSQKNSDRRKRSISSPESSSFHDVGPFARPFLAVVKDPRAAGPHTLVALRALFRLLSNNSFCDFPVAFEPLMKGVLQCKFEQTDAGADEAVEMAIADLLALLVTLDSYAPDTLMDAFNTVFVTRNTFVHSPALCYHFEVVLASLVDSVFRRKDISAKLILEFLVNQLLHTPLSSGPTIDEASREAQIAHDATRVTCLKLTRRCLASGWNDEDISRDNDILHIIQDELCLSLLMTGQAIWANAPGHIPLDILSEICATISTLWNINVLRFLLIPQFESIFTGFYQRALMLLRQRPNPVDSTTFNENLSFDAELELILESLVDLLCLQDQQKHQSSSTLESLFTTYDCDLRRSDVAEHIVIELARCCGAIISNEGVATLEAYEIVDNQRPVPPHLKELCAEALLGCLKTLFPTSEMAHLSKAMIVRSSRSIQECDKALHDTLPEIQRNLDQSSSVRGIESVTPLSHREVKSRKRQFRKAAILFNEKASKGIYFLVNSGFIKETPLDVATFLRNGLVLGLNKEVVGQYLGTLGKAPSAGKSPPCWERDWFHKDVLIEYCGLFRFENQSLLDGLRMFLASFRLPGEGQQIDRIVQAFADSCGRRCDEATHMQLFSDDPKRASDTAFLLAYSIIMLNTDRHNPRIREDKKMSVDAFVRNNSDYGCDINEKGKELPQTFLEGIYYSIREEEIRTEGEGAEGHMTVERWKDVLRGSTVSLSIGEAESNLLDLKELVVDTIWMPVASTVGAFWGVIRPHQRAIIGTTDKNQSGMLGAQGARLGIDIALELMTGVRNIGRNDIFRLFFSSVCGHSGLLGGYKSDAVERASNFTKSVEAQSAVIVSIRTAHEAANELGIEGWMRIWAILFELRDLNLLVGGSSKIGRILLAESDNDLLNPSSRREWELKMAKGSFHNTSNSTNQESPQSFFGFLFGSENVLHNHGDAAENRVAEPEFSIHGKDALLLWDELATSDNEDDSGLGNDDVDIGFDFPTREKFNMSRFSSAGAQFESQLIHEDILMYQQIDTPITGLERVEDTGLHQFSPRARVRKRLNRACDFAGLVLESRFMDVNGAILLLQALTRIIKVGKSINRGVENINKSNIEHKGEEYMLSPASEALAEVLLCEITLKNKDRLGVLWKTVLKDHYSERLKHLTEIDSEQWGIVPIEPGIEKCVTGLLRLCSCALQKEDLANEITSSLCLLFDGKSSSEIEELDKHISEGVWRICSNVDGLMLLDSQGWMGLLGLVEWCAARAAKSCLGDEEDGRSLGLVEDDPGLKVYRSLHLILHAPELKDIIPAIITKSIATLVQATDKVGCSKLCLASVDLLHLLQSIFQNKICNSFSCNGIADEIIVSSWQEILDSICYFFRNSPNLVIRLHALSIVTDAFLDKQGSSLPPPVLCAILPEVCIKAAIGRISELIKDESDMLERTEDIMIEFEQCVSLIFKPFLHHVKNIINYGCAFGLKEVWEKLLLAMEQLLQEKPDEIDISDGDKMTPGILRKTLKELASEHLRNAIMVLHSHGVLMSDPVDTENLSRDTWLVINRMTFCVHIAKEWQQAISSN